MAAREDAVPVMIGVDKMSILRNFKSNIRITSNLHYCDFTILSHQLSQLLQIGQTVKTNVFVTGELIRGTFLMAGIGSGQFGLLNISTSPVNTWVRHARFGMNYTASYMPLLDGPECSTNSMTRYYQTYTRRYLVSVKRISGPSLARTLSIHPPTLGCLLH